MVTISITLKEVQELMRKHYYRRDSERGIHASFTWLVEEVGELAEALLNNDEEGIKEEVADVLAWLASIANLTNTDLEESFRKKYMNPQPP